jgi:Flp pilus assembly protein TadG
MAKIAERGLLASRSGGRSGSAAIEFGLCAPLFIALLMAVIELGLAMYQAMQVYNSVEAGMVYAAKNGWDAAGISAAVINATGTPGIAASPEPAQFCGCPGAGGVTSVVCTAQCSDGSAPGQYVRVSAAVPRQSILPYPALALPETLTAQSIVRLN